MKRIKSIYESDNKLEEKGLRVVQVNFEDGSALTTSMAKGLSDDEIKNYYKVGSKFNVGSGEKDKMVKVKSVKILESAED